MNTELFFWKHWKLGYKSWFSFIFLIFLASVAYMLWGWHQGAAGVIPWIPEGELLTYPVVTGQFQDALFEISTEADTFTIIQRFVAGEYPIRAWVYYMQFGLICFSLLLVLTSATYIKQKIWFGGAVLTILFFIGSANIDAMSISPSEWMEFTNSKLLFAFLSGVLVAVSLAFQHYKKGAYPLRFLAFGLIFIAFGAYVKLYHSKVEWAAMYISNYTVLMGAVLGLVFVILNGHQIVHLIFTFAVQGSGAGRNHSTPFMIFSGVYLLNMLLFYLESNGIIHWHLYYIPPTILLAITAVLSLWGMKGRERAHYGDIISFEPYGALLFVGLALLTTSSLAFAYSSGNDSLVEVYEDLTLYAHVGMALAYCVYVLMNYIDPIPEHLDIKKTFWDAPRSEFSWSAFVGILVFAIFIFRSDYFPYKQVQAAQNVGIADFYRAEGEEKLAEGYYRTAQGYDFLNHKGNYTLGLLYRKNNFQAESLPYFEAANRRKPSPYTYSHILDVYMRIDPLEARTRGQIALFDFPKSSELNNNLGIFYLQKGDLPDSAYSHLLRAAELGQEPMVQQANFFALWPAFNLKGKPTDVIKEPLPYTGTYNNELVYLNRIGEKSTRSFEPQIIKDTTLETADLCYILNFALNKPETALPLIPTIQKYERFKSNDSFVSFLAYARANIWLHNHNTYDACLQMQTLAENMGANDPKFHHAVGTWYHRFEQYKMAADAYHEAFMRMKVNESLNEAIALSSEPSQRASAIEKWTERAEKAKDETAIMARDMLLHLSKDSLNKMPVLNRSDEAKYQYLHFNNTSIDLQGFSNVVKSIQDLNYKTKATLDRIYFEMDEGSLQTALLLREQLTGVLGISSDLLREMQFVDCHLLHRNGRITELAAVLKELTPTLTQKGWVYFFEAAILENQNRASAANELYEKAILAQPFEAEIYEMAAANYNKQKLYDKAYNVYIKGLAIIPRSAKLYAAYTMQCLEQSYMSYAEKAFERTQQLMSEKDFPAFKRRYEALYELKNRESSDWK